MLRRMILAGSILVTALGVLAIAQGPRVGGPGEGGPGRRGFGGGPIGMRMPMSSVMLLSMPEVRKEIGVTEAQQRPVDEVVREWQETQQQAFGRFNFQELRDLEPEERDSRLAEFRKSMDESAKKIDEKLAKLLEAKQVERLGQLQLQREGVGALTRPDIARAVGLNEEQLDKLRDQPPQFGPFGPDPEQARRAEAESLAVLTKEQQEKWSQMKGKEFAFPQFGGPGGPGGFGGPGGPGGFGGPPGGQERQLVKQFDKDGDGRLNKDERKAAREFLKTDGGGRGRGFGPPGFGGGRGGRGRGGPGGGPGGFGRRNEEPKPGPNVKPTEVASFPDAPLYDEGTLRTLFIDFEDADWEQQMADFNNTDVELPATLVVDGKAYPNVGIHFRGMSSFFTVGEGSKRSLNVSLDFVDEKQRLYGYKTLNLLNSHEDPTFLHTVLYLHVAREFIPAPKANFVKVVINGESWGVYVSAQQFNKEFLSDNYPSAKGTRWKVQGSPGGRGGLEYLGDNVEEYKRRYTMKTDDGEKAWKALIALCKTLNETPPEQLEAALEPMLDVDGALWFLALENALINSDGYWIRASDYCIYRDPKGKFHMIPHDANETFQPGMGPGFGGPGGPGFAGGPGGFGRRPGGGREGQPGAGPEAGPGAGRPEQGGPPGDRRRGGPGGFGGGRGNGIEVDPLVGLGDSTKPLRSKLLAVPALKTRYLQHVRTIAETWLDWNKLEPLVAKYESLIDKEIEADTRKLTSYGEFKESIGRGGENAEGERRGRPNLRQFAEQRRAYLLNHPEIKALQR